MGRPILAGATDQSTVIRILDSTTFLPEEAVEHSTSGLALWYRREGGTKATITAVALAALDSAHSDGGIEHIDDGYYRLDLPDAAVAASADEVYIGGTCTGMIIIGNSHALNGLTQADIQSECEDALVAKGLDHLVSTSVAGTDIADDSIIAKLASSSATADWDTYVNTTDSLQANTDKMTSGVVVATNNDKSDYALSAAGVDAILDEAVEGSYTLRQYVRGFAAALFGKLSGASGTNVLIRDSADAKNRIDATVDAYGNRSTVTLDLT